jgi:hypothetical protein
MKPPARLRQQWLSSVSLDVMRLAVIAFIVACAPYAVLRYIVSPASVSGLGSLVALSTESTPDESRLRFHGKIGSGVMYVESVTTSVEGSAIIVTIKSNLPFLAGWHSTPYFDHTLEIPPSVSEVRVGERRHVMWRRGDCHKRYQSYDGWHCVEPTPNQSSMKLKAGSLAIYA